MLDEFTARFDEINARLDCLRLKLREHTPAGAEFNRIATEYETEKGRASLYARGDVLDEVSAKPAAAHKLRREYINAKGFLLERKTPFKSWETIETARPFCAGRMHEAESALALIGETLE